MNENADSSVANTDERPLFLAKESAADVISSKPWKLLIVDDEPEVHSVTKLALSDFRYDGQGLEFISAYSGAEAREVMANDPEIAVMLLDVVMETEDAGLQVVQYVRRMLGNSFVRVVLRTGHPGTAPERRVIKAYDINDYRAKTELTQDRMYALMYASLRTYKYMTAMAVSRRHATVLAAEYRAVLDRVSKLLKEPVANLGASLEQLESGALPEPDRQQMHAACQRLSDIANALDQLGRLSEPKEKAVDFDATEVLGEVLEKLAPQIKADKAIIRHSELPRLVGYPQLFAQLLEQLILNALQHRKPDVAPSIEIQSEAKGKDWQFIIADNCKGIPADRQDKVFEAFASDEETGQTGIGLAMCRRIVALHGGRIWAEPRPGGGSVFEFTIPAGGVSEFGA